MLIFKGVVERRPGMDHRPFYGINLSRSATSAIAAVCARSIRGCNTPYAVPATISGAGVLRTQYGELSSVRSKRSTVKRSWSI
jgi:hypothetical protein